MGNNLATSGTGWKQVGNWMGTQKDIENKINPNSPTSPKGKNLGPLVHTACLTSLAARICFANSILCHFWPRLLAGA